MSCRIKSSRGFRYVAITLAVFAMFLPSSCQTPSSSDSDSDSDSDSRASTEATDSGKTAANDTPSEAGSDEATRSPTESEPPPRTIDTSSFVAIAIPTDGTYRDLTVNGTPITALHISDGGSRVRVEETSLRGRRPCLDLSTDHALPRGYFNSFRMDTNGDGDLADELARDGIWKMDEKGNLTRLDE